MGRTFKAGQLVSPMNWAEDGIDMFSAPGSLAVAIDSDHRVLGRLMKRDVGLVIAVHRADGGSVYVVGPNGSGWTLGAFLTIL